MFKRILLPLDGSSLAEQALPVAVAQAEQFQAELVLLKVLEPLTEVYGMLGSPIRKAEKLTVSMVTGYLESVAARIRKRHISVLVATAVGYPPTQICDFAEANQIDLIVMCTRGYSELTRWLLGSVTDCVFRSTSIPVLLVPAAKKVGARSCVKKENVSRV